MRAVDEYHLVTRYQIAVRRFTGLLNECCERLEAALLLHSEKYL
jgi:hypothetical protein